MTISEWIAENKRSYDPERVTKALSALAVAEKALEESCNKYPANCFQIDIKCGVCRTRIEIAKILGVEDE